MTTEKICRGCMKAKLVTEFRVKDGAPDGLQPYCKECYSAWFYKMVKEGKIKQRKKSHRTA